MGKGKKRLKKPENVVESPPESPVDESEKIETEDILPFTSPIPKSKKTKLLSPDPSPFPSFVEDLSELQTQDDWSGAKKKTSRLIITRMELENFKSFAGKQVIGPFHERFTSIVGPNGSGKSNVIDSLLFVFGKRAKQIRQSKVSELIHNSAEHPDFEWCRVSIHFQEIIDPDDSDDSKYTYLDDTQFVLTRMAFKNNTSKYYMNDKPCKFDDFAKRLLSKGISLDNNRFLIMQGEVEQISLMKPKAQTPGEEGMLEYLEDIIGSDRFIPAIDKKFQELEEAEEIKKQKLNRVRSAEEEKRNLEGPMAEAIDFIRKEQEIIQLASNSLQIKQLHSQEKFSQAETDLTHNSHLLTQLVQELKQCSEHISDFEKQNNTALKVYETLDTQMKEAKNTFTQFQKRDVKCREDMKHFKNQKKKLEKQLETDTKKQEDLRRDTERFESLIAKIEKNIENATVDLQAEDANLKILYESLEKETKPYTEKIEKKQEELAPWMKKKDSCEAQLHLCQSELEILMKRVTEAHQEYEHSTQERASIENQMKQSSTLISLNQKEFEECQNVKIPKLQEKSEQLTREIDEKTQHLSSLEAKITDLRAAQNSSTNITGAVHITLKKLGGKIRGLYGRLGDLGSISDKYDVAITSSCSALFHYVVEDAAAARLCVEHLRKQNAGRATFVMLDQVKYLESKMDQPLKIPPGSQRLFDLVKPKEKRYRTAFYYALGNTLVAPTLDAATKIAYGGGNRWRVVTLSGELIDTSGTMTGGGKIVSRGAMSSRIPTDNDEELLKQLYLETKEVITCLDSLKEKKKQTDQNLQKFLKYVAKEEVNITKMQMDVKSYEARLQELDSNKEKLKQEASLSSEEIKAKTHHEDNIKRKEKELQMIRDSSSSLEKEISDLKEQLLNIGGLKLKVQQHKVDALNEQIDTANTNLTKARVDYKNASKKLKTSTTQLDKLKNTDLAKANLQIETTLQELEKLEDDALTILEAFENAKAELERQDGDVKAIQSRFDELKKQREELRGKEVELQNKKEDNERIFSQMKDRLANFEKKLLHYRQEFDKFSLLLPEELQGHALTIHDTDDLKTMNLETLEKKILVVEDGKKKMNPNMAAIKEYSVKVLLYLERVKEYDTATEVRDKVRLESEDLRKRRLEEFMRGFAFISLKLKEMYQMITLGGDAELQLVDSLDPFSEGIEFHVRPPKKSWKNISNLSGGEKTLSSLALVFALHHFKPTPLYVMDEIDAALDFKNVSIVANYIKDRTKNAQFVIISLRNYMFELADRLVGIYKTHNSTKTAAINPALFVIPDSV